MFQRQSRKAYPASYLFLLAASAIALLAFVVKSLNDQKQEQHPTPAEESVEKEKNGHDLLPAEWWHIVREYPDFRPDVKQYADAMKQASDAVLQRGANPGFSAPWTVQGPANIGARINTIKVNPANPDVIYIGYSQGGVWKTINGGASWFPIFDQQSFLAISDIELDPQNPNTVYVGTGDLNVSGYPFIGDGLWKSPDGGQTWQHLGLTEQRIVAKIALHPTNSNIIYAATMGLPFERNNQRGLYKTINGGQSWQQVLFLSDSTGVIDLEMASDNPNVLYAAGWDRIRNNKESVVSGQNAGIWKTTNGGQNWTRLENGLPTGDKSRVGLSIGANQPNLLVSVVVDSTLDVHGIYKSDDSGASWSALPLDGLNLAFMGGFGWYFGKIYINPFDPNDIFVCGVTVWRSLDGGNTWFQTTPDWWLYEVHADAHDMAFIDQNTCLLATDGGLYRSSDNGFLWEKIENIPTSQFYRVAYNPFEPDVYYGGMQDNGTSAGNSDDIANWPRIWGGDGFQAAFHPTDPNIFYFETQNGSIYGTNDGSFIDNATSGIDFSDRKHWDMQYLISGHDPETMYTGTYRVYQGLGHLPNWFPISDDLTDGNIFGSRYHTISTLHESPVDGDLLYVGTTDGNVWRGNPGSFNWVNISAGLPDRYVSSVKASPSDADRVFVTHTGYKDNDFSPRIHRSDDRGVTWKAIAGDLPNLAVNDIFVLPGHQDSVLFAATDGGVFGTLDGGQHWERLGTGMPVVPVYDMELNPVQRTLIAGTYARSIMTFPLDSLQIGDNVSTYNPGGAQSPRLTMTPNPANVQAKLSLYNMAPKHTTDVFIADLSGRIVWQKTVRSVEQLEIPLRTDDFAPGVYIAFARTQGKVWGQQKCVIAR